MSNRVITESEWEVQYGRRNRETGALHWLTGDPRDDWWHENQGRYEHVKRYTSPPLPVGVEHTAPTDDEQSIRDELIQVLSEQGAEYGGRLDEVADVGGIADAIRRIQAEAWEQGMAYGVNYDAGDYEVPPEPIENPYRRSEVPEPQVEHCCAHPKCPGGSLCCCQQEPEPQGEPSDAAVIHALEAYWGPQSTGFWFADQVNAMRAALRAAGGVE